MASKYHNYTMIMRWLRQNCTMTMSRPWQHICVHEYWMNMILSWQDSEVNMTYMMQQQHDKGSGHASRRTNSARSRAYGHLSGRAGRGRNRALLPDSRWFGSARVGRDHNRALLPASCKWYFLFYRYHLITYVPKYLNTLLGPAYPHAWGAGSTIKLGKSLVSRIKQYN